jgi:uncharacterized spore protein YtfJ
MPDIGIDVMNKSFESQKQALEFMKELTKAADTTAVYSQPVQVGEYTVITASEVGAGGGFGYGGGFGSEQEDEDDESNSGAGYAGGGGGGSSGRPVAVISIGPNGVVVEPVIDLTKIALAAATALGSMFVMARRMRGR